MNSYSIWSDSHVLQGHTTTASASVSDLVIWGCDPSEKERKEQLKVQERESEAVWTPRMTGMRRERSAVTRKKGIFHSDPMQPRGGCSAHAGCSTLTFSPAHSLDRFYTVAGLDWDLVPPFSMPTLLPKTQLFCFSLLWIHHSPPASGTFLMLLLVSRMLQLFSFHLTS